MNQLLEDYLIELHEELKKKGIPLVLGGGMSLYLRNHVLRTQSNDRYNFQIETRSTDDFDLFLSSDLIIEKDKVETLRDILNALGYKVIPTAKNFQFSKVAPVLGVDREIKLDLLAAPPPPKDLNKVSISKPRIKPIGVEGLHAFLTDEAKNIDVGTINVTLKNKSKSAEIFIPSAFSYLILKLHAFNDRKERNDPKSDNGRHHAFDIFATVSRMNSDDWKEAKNSFIRQQGEDHLKSSIQIRKECFSSSSALGLIRLKENVIYQRGKDLYEPSIQNLIDDLSELFPE